MTATNFPITSPQIIVIGAGPVGLYTAFVLARSGCSVRVIDDGRRGAGWASGGMIGAAYEVFGDANASNAYKTFARSSQWLWSQHVSKGGGFSSQPHSVFIARSPQEAAHLEQLSLVASTFHVASKPCTIPTGLCGIHAWACPQDFVVDPRKMLKNLRRDCANAGVGFVQGQVCRVASGAVTLDDGLVLTADHIIVATGQAGNALANDIPELASLSLVKGQMLAVGGGNVRLEHVARAGRVYLIPRDERIVVGATSIPIDKPSDDIDLESHASLLREAIELCPQLANGQLVESWSGMRPRTPDGLPLVGASQVAGVILATGTYRNGWLLAAGIAQGIMGLVLGDRASAANLQLFAPNRFSI